MDEFDKIMLKAMREKIERGEQLTPQEEETYNALLKEQKNNNNQSQQSENQPKQVHV